MPQSEVSKRGWRTEGVGAKKSFMCQRFRPLCAVPFSYAPLGEGGHISGGFFWLCLGACLPPTPSRQPLFETSDTIPFRSIAVLIPAATHHLPQWLATQNLPPDNRLLRQEIPREFSCVIQRVFFCKPQTSRDSSIFAKRYTFSGTSVSSGVRKRVVSSHPSRYQKPERGYIRQNHPFSKSPRPSLGAETVPQRNCVTKIWPNVRVNFLVQFASKPLFYCRIVQKICLVPFVRFLGFVGPSCRDGKKKVFTKGVFSLEESLEFLTSLNSLESLENSPILLCVPESGGSLKSLESLDSLESTAAGLEPSRVYQGLAATSEGLPWERLLSCPGKQQPWGFSQNRCSSTDSLTEGRNSEKCTVLVFL